MVEKYLPGESQGRVKEETPFTGFPVESHDPKSFNREYQKSISSCSSQQNRSGNEVSDILHGVQLGSCSPLHKTATSWSDYVEPAEIHWNLKDLIWHREHGGKMTVTSQRSRQAATYIDEIEDAERVTILKELQRYHNTRRMFLENMEYFGGPCQSTIRPHSDDYVEIPEDGFSRKSVSLLQSKELFHKKAESLRHNLIHLLKEKKSSHSHISHFVNVEDSPCEFDINDRKRSQTSERISSSFNDYETYLHSSVADGVFFGDTREVSKKDKNDISISEKNSISPVTSERSFVPAMESHSDRNATHNYNIAENNKVAHPTRIRDGRSENRSETVRDIEVAESEDNKVALSTKIRDDPSENKSRTVRGIEVTFRAGNEVAEPEDQKVALPTKIIDDSSEKKSRTVRGIEDALWAGSKVAESEDNEVALPTKFRDDPSENRSRTVRGIEVTFRAGNEVAESEDQKVDVPTKIRDCPSENRSKTVRGIEDAFWAGSEVAESKDNEVALPTKSRDDLPEKRSRTGRGNEVTLRAGNEVAESRNIPFKRHPSGNDDPIKFEKKPKSKGKVRSKDKCGYNS